MRLLLATDSSNLSNFFLTSKRFQSFNCNIEIFTHRLTQDLRIAKMVKAGTYCPTSPPSLEDIVGQVS